MPNFRINNAGHINSLFHPVLWKNKHFAIKPCLEERWLDPIWKSPWMDLKMIFSSGILQQQILEIICMPFSCVARFCLHGILFEHQCEYFCYITLKDFSQRGRKMAGLDSGQRWEGEKKKEVCVSCPNSTILS